MKAQFFYQDEQDIELLNLVEGITNKLERVLSENKKFARREQVLDGYFELLQFVRISEYYNNNYKYIVEVINDNI